MDSGGRTGVLVIRVWLEGDPDRRLRARITAVSDPASGASAEIVAVGRDAIVEQVRAWLEEFAHDEAPRR